MGLRSWIWVCGLLALWSCKEELYFIPGTGTLPDCDEAPITNLDGSLWFDQGMVTVQSEGCPGAMTGDEFQSCALNWAFTQNGNDVSIVVDEEYKIEGRLCGNELSLRGGWWLPVVDDEGFCYEDDSAEEVGIQAEGNVLTLSADARQMTGVLAVRGRCSATYDATFELVRDPSLP